jgi:hypothetical protein
VWRVATASSAREQRHTSELDLVFSDGKQGSYRVRGHVDVPQILE